MIDKETRIKIAIQKSGRLTDHSLDLLQRCGLKYTRARDQLICYGENMPLDILLVRDDDIPSLVRDDVCDLGFVGLNIVEETRLGSGGDSQSDSEHFSVLRRMDYGHCRLSFGYPEDGEIQSASQLNGRRIATSYPNIVKDFLKRESLDAEVVEFSGAVEIAPSLGRADVICDLVSTGTTMAAHKIREGETLLESEAVILQTPVALPAAKQEWIDRLMQRIDGVMQVRESKYIMMHAPKSALAKISELLPGSEAPTVLPLEGLEDIVAVHVVCRETVFWETLENLKGAGASSVLVMPVEKMLA